MPITQEELTLYNVGMDLDSIANIDPRGYGVCRILYQGAYEYTKAPLCISSAVKLKEKLKRGSIIYIITGFVLLPHKKAEMDGIVGSLLLARALVKAYGAVPVIVCPEDCIEAVKNISATVGLIAYFGEDAIKNAKEYSYSVAQITFTKDISKAYEQSRYLTNSYLPNAVISIEAPGANIKGVYHNSVGNDISELEAKSDILFKELKELGVLNISIGDLGNEIGMGAISEHILKYVPYTGKGECVCGCECGILADTKADNIITATLSDWGAYALIGAIAFIEGDMDIFHTQEMEHDAIYAASLSGMLDMYGSLDKAIDGIDMDSIISVLALMRRCVYQNLKHKKLCVKWFEKVIEKGYFSGI